MNTPDFLLDPPDPQPSPSHRDFRSSPEGTWPTGDRIIWMSGLVLTLSVFMGWYTGSGVGIKLAVLGWNTGVIGKLVFLIGLATVAIVALRELGGIELPRSAPESLVILALGALATVFVFIRLIWIPDEVLPADGRGIGLWISLIAAIGVIVGGLMRAAEEL